MSKEYVTLGVQRESLINNPLLQKVTITLYVYVSYFLNLHVFPRVAGGGDGTVAWK